MKIRRGILTIVFSALILANSINVYAASLEEVSNNGQAGQQVVEEVTTVPEEIEQTGINNSSLENEMEQINNDVTYIELLKEANDLSETSAAATSVNQFTNTVAGFIIQVLSYFLTAFLAVRVVVDVCYITIPFTRASLCNGYVGQAAQSNTGMVNGMGTGQSLGMQGNMNQMQPMNNMMQGQQGVTPAMGRTQWVSTAALNAVANEQNKNALRFYAKDMTVLLVATTLLLTLALTGVLADLGFFIGQFITNTIRGAVNMI